ncbi:hypothetical protein ACLB2K_041481 [Fragaria x ananassa]
MVRKHLLAFNTHLPILALSLERERPESPGRSPFCRQEEAPLRTDHVRQFLRGLRDPAETIGAVCGKSYKKPVSMTESNEAGVGSRIMSGERSGLSGDQTPGSITRPGGTNESQECTPSTNDPQATPDGTIRDLTHEEMEDMVERLRADVARMERERMRDRLNAATREKKLEADNATIMSVLSRRLESDEAIERAANSVREAQGEGGGSPVTPPTDTRRTVVVGANLFPEVIEREGQPPLPTPVEDRRLETTGVEAALMAMRDSVMSLTTRIDEAERRAAHNPPGVGFEERGGPFTKTITQTLRSRAAKPLKLNYRGGGKETRISSLTALNLIQTRRVIRMPRAATCSGRRKEYLTSVSKLSKPIPGEMLYLYLAASSTAVSSALIRKEDVIELLVYFVGKGYTLAESRYPGLEKLALALIVSARKLRHYFQAHSITLFTNCPLRQVLLKPETSGRLAKWAIELGEFDIHYMPRVAIKGQAAADFILELTPMERVVECSEDSVSSTKIDNSNRLPS